MACRRNIAQDRGTYGGTAFLLDSIGVEGYGC